MPIQKLRPFQFDAAKAHRSNLPRLRIGFSPDLGRGLVDVDVTSAVAYLQVARALEAIEQVHEYPHICSVPCGLDCLGLPIGLQAVGSLLSDEYVLALPSWVKRLSQ